MLGGYVKKAILKRTLTGICLSAFAFMAPCAVGAAEAVPADECAKEMLLSYFPAPIVKETLKKFNIPQEKWEGILSSLSSKDKEVVKIVEQKAAGMNPNPLKDPQQRQAAVKLFRETLLDVFAKALQDNGITDSTKFQPMLDDIQQQKAKKFAMCMEKQKQKAEELDKAAGSTSDDKDSDKNEDSDEDESDGDEDEDENDAEDDDEDDNETSTNPIKK